MKTVVLGCQNILIKPSGCNSCFSSLFVSAGKVSPWGFSLTLEGWQFLLSMADEYSHKIFQGLVWLTWLFSQRKLLTSKLLWQDYRSYKLRNTFKNSYGWHLKLTYKYNMSVSQIIDDQWSLSFVCKYYYMIVYYLLWHCTYFDFDNWWAQHARQGMLTHFPNTWFHLSHLFIRLVYVFIFSRLCQTVWSFFRCLDSCFDSYHLIVHALYCSLVWSLCFVDGQQEINHSVLTLKVNNTDTNSFWFNIVEHNCSCTKENFQYLRACDVSQSHSSNRRAKGLTSSLWNTTVVVWTWYYNMTCYTVNRVQLCGLGCLKYA